MLQARPDRFFAIALSLAIVGGFQGSAHAAPPPPASSGATEISNQGPGTFGQVEVPVAPAGADTDVPAEPAVDAELEAKPTSETADQAGVTETQVGGVPGTTVLQCAQGTNTADASADGVLATNEDAVLKAEAEAKAKAEADADVKAAEEEAQSTDATELQISAGGILNTGNASSAAATGNGKLRVRRDIHQFSAELVGNYGSTGLADDQAYEVTAGNLQARGRYDSFFRPDWSAFLQLTGRHDPFQFLQLRFNVDPGVAYFAVNQPTHRLWVEAGYDFQYDVKTDEGLWSRNEDGELTNLAGEIVTADAFVVDPSIPRTETDHSARVFVGYANGLHKSLSFDTGLEYIQSVLDSQTFRLTGHAGLTAQVNDRFSLAGTFQLRYENKPLPGVKKLDTVTSANVVYRFL